jgi:hypothetical protein
VPNWDNGTQRDAILYSDGANESHGLRRTNEDKRRAVMTLLTNDLVRIDPDTGQPWSSRQIARRCNPSLTFVDKIKAA